MRQHLLRTLSVLLLFCPLMALGHDYWFETAGEGDYLLYRGHRFSQHEGDKVVPYDPNIITRAYCLRSGSEPPQDVVFTRTYPTLFTGPCQAIVVNADTGFWSQTITGTKNQSKDNLSGVLRSWHALETIKRVELWNKQLLEPLSSELELVFTENPFALVTGDKLRLKATKMGQPVQGVTVAYNGKPRGITDKNGRINLRIRQTGLQVISASYERPLINNIKADKQIDSTLLIFELK